MLNVMSCDGCVMCGVMWCVLIIVTGCCDGGVMWCVMCWDGGVLWCVMCGVM